MKKQDRISMSVRFEKICNGERTVIQVAGDLRGRGVVELERLCREISGPISLDLLTLRSSDDQGVTLIKELARKGVDICGVSPYMDLLLK
jgi:hypothetical protein